MSEYQYYEFQAIDRQLTERELREVRACSTRATVTSRRFVNTYEWGDFKGNPGRWMEKYFDAFLYLANWGTHQVMLRFPRRLLDLATAKRYCRGGSAAARAKGDLVILEFHSDDESGADQDDGGDRLSSILPVRACVAVGDHRALYLAWLRCAQEGELDEDETEPPVPEGLGKLTAPLQALADFLRIDHDLLAAAQAGSVVENKTSPGDLERWITALPEKEKTRLLTRIAVGEESHPRAEILRSFRQANHPGIGKPASSRTVAALLASAERHRMGGGSGKRRAPNSRRPGARARRRTSSST